MTPNAFSSTATAVNAPLRRVAGRRLLSVVLAAWLVALLLLLLPLLAPATHAYVLEGPRWPNNKTITMTLGLGTPNRTLSDGATDWNPIAQEALNIWNGYLGSGVRFAGQAAGTQTGVQSDNVNTVYFAANIYGKAFGGSTLAVTTYFYSGSTISEADVVFNNTKAFDSYRGALRYDSRGVSVPELKRVAVHEFGHALGLDHPDEAGQSVTAIMNARISSLESPQSDDIAGLQAIYGAPTTPPSSSHPAFFTGEEPLSNGVYYLAFPGNGNIFGYYTYFSDPHYLYHFDMGYEYVVAAADGSSGLYLYDFASNSWFYTSPSFPFPYLYDFTLGATLYYFPTNNNPQRYTTGPRYFYNFKIGQVIMK